MYIHFLAVCRKLAIGHALSK